MGEEELENLHCFIAVSAFVSWSATRQMKRYAGFDLRWNGAYFSHLLKGACNDLEQEKNEYVF